ncbi:D-2-hydroxyglutarate dehydrogenase YdiJ [Bartonella sp. LJL80]
MSPVLKTAMQPNALYSAFITFIAENGFSGDIAASYGGRLIMATDNSIYQRMPQAVLYPRCSADIQLIMRLAAQEKWRKIILTPRGGGTGTNGQSLTDGIVVDLSRHMNHILEVNIDERWVRVQTGVVKDQLNAELAKHGFFFAPELSTSNRATIGGMINTDACGQGSCTYGKTRHHVLELSAILLDGSQLQSRAVDMASLDQLCSQSNKIGNIYRVAREIAQTRQQDIKNHFPVLNRSLTGYDLAHLVQDDDLFNLNSILCGAEGSLAFLTEAKLNILPIPKHSRLVSISYTGFMAALSDAQTLMQHRPISIETIDSRVLGLAKQDNVWQAVSAWFPTFATQTEGINLVEFSGDDAEDVEARTQAFITMLKNEANPERLGQTVASSKADIAAIYNMRKKAVGLLGNMEGEARPQPFVEDTAVPPEKLADYIAEFRALLDQHQLEYGMFGHVDAGVLHVRPALDMKNPDHAKLIRPISDAVVELTHRYGGVIWGEHGKGLRSEYVPHYFGPLYTCLQQLKAAFDPFNQLNPGKIATAAASEKQLTRLDEVGLRADMDKQIPNAVWKEYGPSMHCNGNGACFNYDLNDAMCPSYKATRDRMHSPKGRSSMMREFLRLENGGSAIKQTALSTRFINSITKPKVPTLTDEVFAAMSGCLACKSCVGQCPIKVNIPDLKSRFMEIYYRRYLRPVREHMVARLETIVFFLALAPSIGNLLLKPPFLGCLTEKIIGLVDTPKLSRFNLTALLRQYKVETATVEKLSTLSVDDRMRSVILVQDAFTRYFETPLMARFIQLVTKLGYKVYLAPLNPNGKAMKVLGFNSAFDRTARNNASALSKLAQFGIPFVGIDPAMTLVYRQEYRKIANLACPDILLPQEWLNDRMPNIKTNRNKTFRLLAHCTEKTNDVKATAQWMSVFNNVGAKLVMQPVGCCGMSGTFGHERSNKHMSETIFKQSWQGALDNAANAGEEALATGYSCRSQVKRFRHAAIRHPIEALLDLID